MFIGDFGGRLSTSAPFTSVSSSITDPALFQVCFSPGSPLAWPSPHLTPAVITADTSMGGNEGGGGRGLDRWSLFDARPTVQKSPTDPGSDSNTSGSFSLQSYFGLQKSTTLDGIKTQVNLAVEDPAKFKSAKLEVSGVEGKKASAHKLKHRDMNILTPSGF